MAVTFDGPNLTITLESAVTAIAWIDVYSDWKRWVQDGGGHSYPAAFRPLGGDPLSAVLDAGSYFFLQNQDGWRIKPPEEDITILAEGNLALEDADLPSIIPTTGAFTAAIFGIQPVSQGITPTMGTQLEEVHGGVRREVWLDTSLGTDGSGYQQSPFNSLTSAIDYAEANGITGLVVLDDITLTRNLKNFQVRGVGLPTVDLAGFDMKGCRFHGAKLTGTYIDTIIADDCTLNANMYLNGTFRQCALAGDLFCVAGGTVFMTGCGSAVPGLGRPTITMSDGGARVLLSVRDNNGGMTIKGSTHADDEVTVEVNRGSLTFDASNTAGAMVARTSGVFINNANGATVTREDMVQRVYQRIGLGTGIPATNNVDGSYSFDDVTVAASVDGSGNITHNRTA